MSTTEYAKLARWYTPSDGVTGVKTTMTIPTAAAILARNGNGFINFYLSADGSGHHVECGISTSFKHQGDKWHWFYTWARNGSGGDDTWSFRPGQVVPIELSINADKTALDYIVNGAVVKSFPGTYSTLTSVRLVVGACDQNFPAGRVPDPLPDWATTHSAVTCSEFQYRDSAGSWITCTASNSTPPTPHGSGQSSAEVHWPSPTSKYPHKGLPFEYSLEISPGTLIASLPESV
ncbi:hypothetical protein [Paenibacillus agilis]|uniref:Uncharacterized protein n=1 Tax=Paenibacillus agilis TaxID=3020863 RepID=A0A559IVL2_9BACL|nr:hypothetical protein [Paenibacillus agilis]TVX91687.1 hypothetical protein FPZ44_00615 [Paenibacillus agilis]